MHVENNNLTQKGLSGFSLKIIALILMTIDHIHQFFSSNGIPMWFNWLGRLSAPLFFFTMAEGFFYTRNKFTYIKRLYFFSVIMSLGKFLSWKIYMNNFSYSMVNNNIFETFFLVSLNILLFEYLKDENKELYKKVSITFIAIIFEIILPISVYLILPKSITKIVISFFPCPLFCEGGFIFVILGIIFFHLRDNSKKMIIIYLVFSLIFFPFTNFSIENLLNKNNQWMMLFAVPFMMLYDGRKGHGLKYLFYIYYPVHIFLFFFIAGIIK